MPTFDAFITGALHCAVVRQALGDRFHQLESVVVSALVDGHGVVQARVRLTDKIAGRTRHRRFACPGCNEAAEVLRWHGERGFLCGRCAPHRTAHQRRVNTAWWRAFDGDKLDELLRLSRKRSGRYRLSRMSQLAEEIVRRDRARIEAIMPRVAAALSIEEGA